MGRRTSDVLYVAPLQQIEAVEDLDAAEPVRQVTRLLEFVKTLSSKAGDLPRLRLLTCECDADPVQSALRGFFRSVVLEYPEFRPITVDLSANPTDQERELALADFPESMTEVRLRGGQAFVPRLVMPTSSASCSPAQKDEAFRATLEKSGEPDQLCFVPLVRKAPAAGEVELEVFASGLNFINALSAMGLYPGSPDGFRSLGIECAGQVVSCGQM